MFRVQIARVFFTVWKSKLKQEKTMGMKDIMGKNSYSTCLFRLWKVSDINKDEDATIGVYPPNSFDFYKYKRGLRFDVTIFKILKIYNSIHDNLQIPYRYKIPAENPWPPEFHGYKLGRKVYSLRRRRKSLWGYYAYRLDKLGFIWDPLDYRFNKAVQAMKVFKLLYGNLVVPQRFKVPADSVDWPKQLWGYNLGRILFHIRCNGVYRSKRKYLEELGVPFEVKPARSHDFKLTKKCIKIYKKKFGTFQIPYSYTIPKDDKDYPARARGIPLGHLVANIIHRKDYLKHHDELRRMGVSLLPRYEYKFNLYFEAIQRYKEIYGNLSVPVTYVIPEDSDKFPPHMWGKKLGRVVRNIRTRGDFKEFHHRFQELGLTPAKAIVKAVETPAEGQTQPPLDEPSQTQPPLDVAKS